jgi:Fe-S cluster biogenesis protein NfuA
MSRANQASRKRGDTLRHRVDAVLASLRPLVRRDGGDIELVDIEEGGIVRVRLRGACVGCPSSRVTLTLGIERNLRDRIPEITRVVCA